MKRYHTQGGDEKNVVEEIMTLSPNLALVIILGLTVLVIAICKKWKSIWTTWDNLYNWRRKSEEQERMIKEANEKVKQHEVTISQLNDNVSKLKEMLDKYCKENQEHWKTSVKYRENYDQQKSRDDEKHEELIKTQTQLAANIQLLTKHSTAMDDQITALALASKELLADTINQRYNKYIKLKGIPADEVDEFTNIHTAYNKLKGNNVGDAKYNYVTSHLPVLPVETKLVLHETQ